ncbi:MAG: tannase/feruloyl esterase family alpha/beta hydrolase [Bacteroidales bacterium]|jgi:feruloyl esterase|nr:tannase/feruloyl esterase family alpha/beta hydrolase [Bacteroidales bacterium]
MKRLFIVLISLCVLAIEVDALQISSSTNKSITRSDIEKAGSLIPVIAIGEPVGSVKLYPPRWIEATDAGPAYGVIEGSIFPVDPKGWPINFRVLLPSSWSYRSMQMGGGGMNGTITVREGRNPMLNKGFVLYGSDSGHQSSMGGRDKPLATGPEGAGPDDWVLNEEAVRNLGYMQMKKTHDAAMLIIERIYGERPRYNYYSGGSQGGREGLMVAQRYPEDYDGIISDVPIVSFSSLMLAPELIRIQEKPVANWITPSLTGVIRTEFLRQCDELDGLADGIINNYMASREIFDVTDGKGPADPWKALRKPDGGGNEPEAEQASDRLTPGQISTLEFIYSPYRFPAPLANKVKSFGMWLPNTEPDAFGTITGTRYKGQEGAGEDAPVHTSLGVLGVTGILMQDVSANPLDYTETKEMNKRRKLVSEWLDATSPDLTAFLKRGGKIIITSGTQDFIASSGAQLDYYQSLVDKMGQDKLDQFARLYVVPQGGHGLSGRSYRENGKGESITVKNIPSPNSADKTDLLIAWVEEGRAPSKTLVVSPEGRISEKPSGKGYLLCSYPAYPKYVNGPADEASSYVSASE